MVSRTRKASAGFTLIELLVVVIIVAVLAAVGVPMLSGNVQRARFSEAEAGLGTIRTGMRTFFAERGTYVGATLPLIGLSTNAGVVTGGDLDGRFFEDNDYDVPATGVTLTATTFCVSATGKVGSVAPKASQVTGLTRSINERGDLFSNANCTAAGLLN